MQANIYIYRAKENKYTANKKKETYMKTQIQNTQNTDKLRIKLTLLLLRPSSCASKNISATIYRDT